MAKNQTQTNPNKPCDVELTVNDVANLVAFGNRAQMNGAEADTWVELKTRMVIALQETEGEQGATDVVSPGGSA